MIPEICCDVLGAPGNFDRRIREYVSLQIRLTDRRRMSTGVQIELPDVRWGSIVSEERYKPIAASPISLEFCRSSVIARP
jgi:hypothetical protein